MKSSPRFVKQAAVAPPHLRPVSRKPAAAELEAAKRADVLRETARAERLFKRALFLGAGLGGIFLLWRFGVIRLDWMFQSHHHYPYRYSYGLRRTWNYYLSVRGWMFLFVIGGITAWLFGHDELQRRDEYPFDHRGYW